MKMLMKYLPEKIQGFLMRKFIKIELPIGKYSEVVYKVAESIQEKEEAFKLVKKVMKKQTLTLLKTVILILISTSYFLLQQSLLLCTRGKL